MAKGYRAEFGGIGYHGPAVSGGEHLLIQAKIVDGLKSGIGRPVWVEIEPGLSGHVAWTLLDFVSRHFPDQAVCHHKRKTGHPRAGGVECADCGAPLPADPSYPPGMPVPDHKGLVEAARRVLATAQRVEGGPGRKTTLREREQALNELQHAVNREVWFTAEGEPKRLLKGNETEQISAPVAAEPKDRSDYESRKSVSAARAHNSVMRVEELFKSSNGVRSRIEIGKRHVMVFVYRGKGVKRVGTGAQLTKLARKLQAAGVTDFLVREDKSDRLRKHSGWWQFDPATAFERRAKLRKLVEEGK